MYCLAKFTVLLQIKLTEVAQDVCLSLFCTLAVLRDLLVKVNYLGNYSSELHAHFHTLKDKNLQIIMIQATVCKQAVLSYVTDLQEGEEVALAAAAVCIFNFITAYRPETFLSAVKISDKLLC